MIECEGIDFNFEERLEPEIEEKSDLGDKLDRGQNWSGRENRNCVIGWKLCVSWRILSCNLLLEGLLVK